MNNMPIIPDPKKEHKCENKKCGTTPAYYRHICGRYLCHKCYTKYVMKRVIITTSAAVLIVAFTIMQSPQNYTTCKPIKWTVEVKKGTAQTN